MKKNKNENFDELYEIYCIDVLNISKNYAWPITKKIKKLEVEFKKILELWLELDDNNSFFKIASTNWSDFIKWKEDVYKLVSGEDVLWFKGFLKYATYYNKRYIIPK